MSTRRKALIFIDADVVVRHFLDSGALSRLFDNYETTLIFPPEGWNRLCNNQDISRWGVPVRRIAIPEVRQHLFNQLFFIDQARRRTDPEWREIRAGWFRMIGRKASLKFSLLALPTVRPLAIRAAQRQLAAFPATELDTLLREVQPDILVHPSVFKGCFINDLIEVGRAQGIPVLLMMNSWDNPSLKRTTVGIPDAVTVWGEQTARHTSKFMGIPRERIHILGAAQFQVFTAPPGRSRAEICAQNGIDPSKRILLYAGSSKGNCESLHLRRLDNAVANGTIPDANILYRPHPFGLSAEEARQVLAGGMSHVVVEAAMRDFLVSVAEGRNQGFYSTPYADTHSLLTAIDVLISPLSTILIEAGLHGKPALCFVPEEEDRGSTWSTLRRLVHFQELMHSPALTLAQSHAEFLPAVQNLFAWAEDPAKAEFIRAEMAYFAEFPATPFAQAIASLADGLVADRITP